MSSFQKSMFKPPMPPGRMGMQRKVPAGVQSLLDSEGGEEDAEVSLPATSEGYCPLDYKDVFDECHDVKGQNEDDIFKVYTAGGKEGTWVLFLHGGGHSALTWSMCVKEIKKAESIRIMALDLRAHGGTSCSDEYNVSIDNLIADCSAVVHNFFDGDPPKILLVGHSMGGALAAKLGESGKIPVAGVVVIDVVEGTAMASLVHMGVIVNKRPRQFKNVETAVEWSVRSGGLKNLESARYSIPAQLVKNNEGKMSWRTDLMATEPHWKGWFQGLSQAFLKVPGPKLLLLAGTDRLDKDLTIAQMQGKFQMMVLPASGHCVQEDQPAKTASSIVEFIRRNRLDGSGEQMLRLPVKPPPPCC